MPCARPDFYLLFDCFPQAQKALSEKNKGGDERLSSKNKYIEELEVAEKTKRLELKKGLMMRFRINVSIRLLFDETIFMQRSPRSMSICCVFLLHSSFLYRIVCLFYLFLQGFELAHHGSVNDAVFSPSEGRVATAGGDALVKVS